MIESTQFKQWTAETILQFLHEHFQELQGMGITKIGLFGSYARNEQEANSDIDLIFTMDNITFTQWMDVWNYLEDHFREKIDLVPEQNLRDEIRPNIMREVRYVEE